MNQSWIKEVLSFKDYCTEVLYAGAETKLDEFCHDTTGLPVVFQGPENSCVACSVTFVQQWIEKNHPNLSHEWLMQISGTTSVGAKPKEVLEAARTIGICMQEVWDNDRDNGYLDAGQHQIAGYAKSTSLKLAHLGFLIEKCPIMVGVDNFRGAGPHMMAAKGFNLSTNVVKCANWWKREEQDFIDLDAKDITFACAILEDKPIEKPTMKILEVIKDKLTFIPKKWIALAGGILLILASLGSYTAGEQLFGAGYVPITGYSSRTTSYVSAVATTIPVASTKDKAGNAITLANVSPSSTVRIYMNIEAGKAREELIACTGVTAVSWTNCTRGLTFQGSSTAASSTLAKAHNSGANIIISNTGQFYGEYLTIDGAQNVYGTKTFYTFPVFSNTATLCTTDGQFCTKKYIDTVGAGGFTSANVSTTRGLSVDGSAPEKVGIKLVTGYGLRFLKAGTLAVATSSPITFSSLSATSTYLGLSRTATQGTDVLNMYSGTMNMATGTAKLAVTIRSALWVGPTSTLAMTDTTAASSTFQFIGIAKNSASAGGTITYVRPGGVACGFSGLVPGMDYFLNGSAGEISATDPTNYKARIGKAVTTKCLLVTKPSYKIAIQPTIAICNGAADYTLVTSFRPLRAFIAGANYNGQWSSVGQNTLWGASTLAWLDGRVMKYDCAGSTFTDWTASVGNGTFKLTKTNTGSPSGSLNVTPYIIIEGE